jgi:hypothetical protein
MSHVIDRKTLSKEGKFDLLLEIIKFNKELSENLYKIVPIEEDEISYECCIRGFIIWQL